MKVFGVRIFEIVNLFSIILFRFCILKIKSTPGCSRIPASSFIYVYKYIYIIDFGIISRSILIMNYFTEKIKTLRSKTVGCKPLARVMSAVGGYRNSVRPLRE